MWEDDRVKGNFLRADYGLFVWLIKRFLEKCRITGCIFMEKCIFALQNIMEKCKCNAVQEDQIIY